MSARKPCYNKLEKAVRAVLGDLRVDLYVFPRLREVQRVHRLTRFD